MGAFLNRSRCRVPVTASVAGLVLALSAMGPASAAEPATIDFNRDVRPLLSDRCFKCHGPDAAERKSGLRLDVRDEALQPAESGQAAIVPGKTGESELIARIFAEDESQRMPPADSGKSLSDAERDVLKRWVAEGAKFQQHWAFVAPSRAPLPAVKLAQWPRNAVDHFILARLEAQGLRPSNEADRATLIRRLTFDLTGLPPTLAEIDDFLLDNRPDAYERVVDRLLASPHFGERMALDWLDAARFADTHGYHIDSGRDMTKWREWVIDSYNRNRPFDQFTIEQLAGDLLPDANDPKVTVERQIASGFNRNHMINYEGGAIPEEYHAAYIIDRVNTTGTVWLGLAVGCAQCHDHKYDPITQRDYYQLYAFFHNIPENGLDGRIGNAEPMIKTPSADQEKELGRLTKTLADLEQRYAGPIAEVDAAQLAWEKTAAEEQPVEWRPIRPAQATSRGGAKLAAQEDRSIVVEGDNPATDTYTVSIQLEPGEITGLRLETLPDDRLPAKGPGRSHNGNIVLSEVRLALASAADPSAGKPITMKKATADFSQENYGVERTIDGKLDTGWAVLPEVGKPHAAVFEPNEPIKIDSGSVLSVALEFQSQFAQHQLGKFRISVTSSKDPHSTKSLPDAVRAALAVAGDNRSDAQREELKKYFREQVSPEAKQLRAEIDKVRAARDELDKRIPTAMVMREMEKPRDTFMLVRGQYDKKGEQVVANVPAALLPLSEGAPSNRLGLAQWLVDPKHPLTARVAVNRYWQMFFGTGLVKTAEDFGSQGEAPSHPELLDWLACEFVAPSSAPLGTGSQTPWDIKAVVRLIVTSSAYRQSSAITPELLAADPENRLLSRGPRLRLPAEFIRDTALATSGLLQHRIGGPSVSPYQPPRIWEELGYRDDNKNFSAQSYEQSHGADLYRRTMYTFWKRTAPPPSLITLDAPDRETCTVRRPRTNTPLQALVLLNDPTYVEAARKLAERVMTEGGATTEDRVAYAFRLATARRPSADETRVLARLYAEQLAVYRQDADAAKKLLTVGESPRNEQLDPAEHAAWTTVASTILNLDETVTKG